MTHPRQEATAGLIAAIVAVPQCVALGIAAFGPLAHDFPGLARVAGFYSAIVAGLFVGLGARGQITLTGPRIGSATVLSGTAAALLASGADPLSVLGMIFVVMIAAGLLQGAMGMARLASLQSYIARPVIVGLMSGVACTMLLAQGREIFRGPPAAAIVASATFAVAVTIWALGKFANLPVLKKQRWIVSWGMVFATVLGIALYYALPQSAADRGGTLGAIAQFWVVPDVVAAMREAGSSIARTPTLLWDLAPAVLMLAVVGSLDTTNSHVATRHKLLKRDLSPRQRLIVSSDNENRQLQWHGLGNAVAGLFGGIPSAASDARAEAALAADGRTWVGGLVYTAVLSALLVGSPWLVWSEYFPKAVVVGLMLHIAILLLSSQLAELGRYARAFAATARDMLRAHRATPGPKEGGGETVLNGLTVLVVACSLHQFDPMRAIAVGMLCSMSIFLFKIGQSQRHRSYSASERISLQLRPAAEAAIARAARERCQIIKLHGDFFFLSHKMAMSMVDEVRARVAAHPPRSDGRQYVIIDFDMAHEFDESGIHEIKLMVERLQEYSFVVLLSYVLLKSGLAQLLRFDHVIDGPRKGRSETLIRSEHVFDTTERAINYVEDQAVLREGGASNDVRGWPPVLASLTALPSRRFDQASGAERFWVVRRGTVVLRHRVSQTVADVAWKKVIAEVGCGGVISGRIMGMRAIDAEIATDCDLTSVDDEWLAQAIEHRPAETARIMAYFADYIASLNSMLQTEMAMLDH